MSVDELRSAWSQALPAVLRLLEGARRDLFRHELQRFLAARRFVREADVHGEEALRELLLQAVRAARQPAAISATREHAAGPALVLLVEHILTIWRDAESEASGGAHDASCDGIFGEVVFGPRLGGPGRSGALRRPGGGGSDQ
jgi:hypothetical protein